MAAKEVVGAAAVTKASDKATDKAGMAAQTAVGDGRVSRTQKMLRWQSRTLPTLLGPCKARQTQSGLSRMLIAQWELARELYP